MGIIEGQALEQPEVRFVAVNEIDCKPEYTARFSELFKSRAKAIDRVPGFLSMVVLEPKEAGAPYLVISHWTSEEAFYSWTKGPEFHEGHRRAFEDMRLARERGEEPPMHSKMSTYSVLTT